MYKRVGVAPQTSTAYRAFITPGVITPSLVVCTIACLLTLLLLAANGWQQSGRSLWQDESTLLANLGLPWRTYFHSLPFYDQAAPPLALLILNATYALAGGDPVGMRLLVLGMHLGILAMLALNAVRKDDRAVLLAISTIVVSALALRYSLELKQYMFELQASLIFMLALRWYPTRPIMVMALAAVLSFASFSIMLVVGIATFDAVLLRFRGHLRWRWFIALAIYSVGWIACYLLLFKPATALQMGNYSSAYERHDLRAYAQAPGLLVPQFEAVFKSQPILPIAGAIAAFLAILGWRKVMRPQRPHAPGLQSVVPDMWHPLRVMIGLGTLIVLLWLAKFYPISSSKQFLFILPITAMLLSHCVMAASAAFASGGATAAMLFATLAPSALYTTVKGWTLQVEFQDTRGLYAFVRSQPSALILPDLLFEPTLRTYAPRDPNPPVHVAGWLRAESEPMPSPAQVLADLAKGHTPINQHIWQPLHASDQYAAYVTWLVGHARGAPESILATALIGPKYDALVYRAAQSQGCTAREAYRSRGVVAFRILCPTQR